MPRRWIPQIGLLGILLAMACSGPSNLGQTSSGNSSGGGSSGGVDGSTGGGGGGSGGGGSSSGGGGGGAAEEDAGMACNDYAAAKCAKFDACTQGVYTQVHFGSAAICQSREALSCLGTLSAPDNTATPNGFERCGQDITAGSCSDFFDLTNSPPACTPNMGARANGSACVNNGQCQSTWCYAPATAVCGVCATRPAVGATCAANVDCGGEGLLCSTANTCAAVVAMGGACDNSHPCGFALSCVAPSVTEAGTCQPEGVTVGAACDASKTSAPLCEHDFGLFCPSATDLCAQASLVGTSQACGVMAGVKSDAGTGPSSMATCNGGGACEPSTATKGVCIAPAADGAACDSVLGPPCLAPARCVTTSDASTSGTCAILEQTTCN